MARVVRFHEYGSADTLAVDNVEITDPGDGQVRLRMKAVALNRGDGLFREGKYLLKAKFPSRIGNEGVGVIDALGPNAALFAVGQRVGVMLRPPLHPSDVGVAADYVVVPESTLFPVPDSLDDRQAATAWVPFLTLYHLFVEESQAAKGRWLVLPAASSSVSLAANSLAHHLGARTIGITRTAAKRKALEAAGFDEVVVSRTEDVGARIKDITTDGADFVFDPVGGPLLETLITGVKRGADINVYGILHPEPTALPVFAMMNSGARLSCYTAYELLMDDERLQQAVDYLLPLLRTGKIAPVADSRTWSLDQIGDAFRHQESNTQFGKVIVTV